MIARRLLALALLAYVVPARADQVDTLAKRLLKANTPGVEVIVVKKGRVVRDSCYGFADVENEVPVRPETVFEIGSDTKQFTATEILMLLQDGKLSLDDPVGKYVEGLSDTLKVRTIRQCLTHTAGVAEYLGNTVNMRKDYRPEEVLDMINKAGPDFDAGAAWSYSNGGYFLLGLVVEKVSGMSWADFTRKKIFQPLGMEETYIQEAGKIIPHRAHGYVAGTNSVANAEILRPSVAFSAGAILSTGNDLAKWVTAVEQSTLLKPEIGHLAVQPVLLRSGRTYPYGFAQMLDQVYGEPEVEHGGNTYGFSSQITRFPKEDLAVIVLTNAANLSHVQLAREVAKAYLEEAKPLPPPQVHPDPDKQRTSRMIDALTSLMANKPDPALVDSESMAIFQTKRGKMMGGSMKMQFGRILALFYMGEKKVGTDTEVTYELHTSTKLVAPLALLISNEGKLVRIQGVAE